MPNPDLNFPEIRSHVKSGTYVVPEAQHGAVTIKIN
jgi:hypothetical protein